MTGPQKKKKHHVGDTFYKRKYKTKHRARDIDEVDKDLKKENADRLLKQALDFDKPGEGQHYCIHCARYFLSDQVLQDHFRTKLHKKRIKELRLEPYTIEEAERAAGFGSYIAPKERVIVTQPINVEEYKEPEEVADICSLNIDLQ
ncbi:zinc finger protein 593-like isoform X2 [Myzus persicae]|uniref:zinc finger protein 593-like isoform X2 n=1 Tax=Myzus persicae TaxID=13164 RepID=UPI000B934B7A|nr:zinc finger protein 593-like isoform X2 [Myzus persicae]